MNLFLGHILGREKLYIFAQSCIYIEQQYETILRTTNLLVEKFQQYMYQKLIIYYIFTPADICESLLPAQNFWYL